MFLMSKNTETSFDFNLKILEEYLLIGSNVGLFLTFSF